jgi:hypothetical protein
MTSQTIMLRLGAFLGIGAFMLFAAVPQAKSSSVFTLDKDGCTGTCGTGPFGTITLIQDTSTSVSVTLDLAANERFAGTGAGDALEFNVFGFSGTLKVTNLSPSSGFSVGGADSASTFGSFLESIICTVCQGGSSSNPAGPLSFEVTSTGAAGVTLADFVANTGGYYFASDIVGTNGKTGNVATKTFAAGSPPPSAPEPVSVVLVGVGLLALRLLQVRRRSAK